MPRIKQSVHDQIIEFFQYAPDAECELLLGIVKGIVKRKVKGNLAPLLKESIRRVKNNKAAVVTALDHHSSQLERVDQKIRQGQRGLIGGLSSLNEQEVMGGQAETPHTVVSFGDQPEGV